MPGTPNALRACSLALASALLWVSCASIARADEAADYEQCRSYYSVGKHIEAVGFCGRIVEGPTATVKDPALVAKTRMIIGASDFWLGRKGDALTQFEVILHANMNYQPDPLLFPSGVYEEFKRTHDRIEKEEKGKKADDQAKKELDEAKKEIDKLKTRVDAWKKYSSEERVVTHHSRLVATIPFGVGQFQNGQTALGIVFLGAETIALGSAVIAYGIHESIPPDRNIGDFDRARSVESSSRIVNQLSSLAFLLLAGGGIVHAHLTYVPESYETRTRPPPPGLSRIQPILAPTAGGFVLGFGAAF